MVPSIYPTATLNTQGACNAYDGYTVLIAQEIVANQDPVRLTQRSKGEHEAESSASLLRYVVIRQDALRARQDERQASSIERCPCHCLQAPGFLHWLPNTFHVGARCICSQTWPGVSHVVPLDTASILVCGQEG